jgi:hypothetical protein
MNAAIPDATCRDKAFLAFLLLTALFACEALCQSSNDARWDNRFAVAGVQGNMQTMAFDKKHIYIGGQMRSVGRVIVDAVAHFDGKRWEALPDGPQQDPTLLNVLALEMFKNRLYVGGFFTNVGGVPAGGFASWHGNKWTVEGTTNGVVYTLKSDDRSLLVGGRLTLPGFTNPIALARFDGRNWKCSTASFLHAVMTTSFASIRLIRFNCCPMEMRFALSLLRFENGGVDSAILIIISLLVVTRKASGPISLVLMVIQLVLVIINSRGLTTH